jgi:hypothetical protein
MLKSKLILLGAIVLISFSSCGIFKKGCGCPHFGKINLPDVQMCKYAGVQMIG